MATVRERPRSTSAVRHEQVVETQLNKALSRIRGLDLTTGFLSFLALTLGFSLIMALIDRWLSLPLLARQIALVGYGGTVVTFLAFFVVRPLLRQINPYYAARQVEKTLPSAKNSVVNWLDLRDEPISPAILGAVGQRAAHDLAQTDLEQAISGKRAAWLGSITGILVVAQFIALIFWGFPTFSSLWGRTFAPFNNFGITSKTRIEVKTKDVTIPVDHAVTISVAVAGKVPDPAKADALKLHIRYRQGDPYEEPILLEPESERDWFTTVAVTRVQSGFWYKVSGGDYETDEYRVIVRSLPMITSFDVRMHYRPYLGWVDKSGHNANLHDVVGTEATLVVHTNRPVTKGTLVFEPADKGPNKKQITSTPVKDDAKAMSFGLVLESGGVYRIKFTSTDGESSADSPDYTITVIPDNPPSVVITTPREDTSLPAIGTLRLEGFASDDFGIKQMTLRMMLNDGTVLKAKPYREGTSFKLGEAGGYPQMLDYKDFVELPKLKSEIGQAVNLLPGAVIEYWLEAQDAFDMPTPHVSQSKHYKLTIAEPEQDKKKEQEEQKKAADQAKQEQKEHQDKQDQKLNQEKQKLQEKNEEQKEKTRQDQKKNEQSDSGKSDENQAKDGSQDDKNKDSKTDSKSENKDDAKKDNGKKPDTKPDDQGNNNKDPNQDKSDNEANKDKDTNTAKNPDSKADGQSSNDKKSDGDKNPDSKPNGKDDKSNDPNQAKKDGDKGGGQDEKNQSTDASDNNPNTQGKDLANQGKDLQKKIEDRENQKSQAKEDPADKKGEEKGQGKPQPAPDKGEGKDNAKNQQPQPDKQDRQDGQAKNAGDPNAAGADKKSDKKDGGQGQQADQKPADAKDKPQSDQNAGAPKNDGKPQNQQTAQKSDAKDHGKPSPDKKPNDKEQDAQEGASKGEGNPQSRDAGPKSENKDAGKGQPEQKAADSKDKPQGKESIGVAKNDSKADQPPSMGDKKEAGKEGADKNVAQEKGQAGAKPDEKQQEAAAKNEGKPDQSKNDQDKASAKAENPPKDKAEKKEGKADGQAVADNKKPESNNDKATANAGENKPAPKDKGESTASAKGEEPKDKNKDQKGNGTTPAKDAKPDDVKKLAEHMKGDDGDKKDAAERQLKDIAKDAKDEQARKDAQKALQDAKKDGKGEDKVADAKKPPMNNGQPMDKGQEGTDEPKKGTEKNGENTAEAKKDGETGKDDGKKGQPKDASETARGNPKDPMNDGNPMKTGEGSDPANAKDRKPSDKGKATGDPTTAGDPAEAGKARQTEEPPGGDADPRFRDMANEMQLKNVREMLDKKLLDGSMTDEEKAAYKDWLKKYQEYKRSHPEDVAEPDVKAPKTDSKQVNRGVSQFKPGKIDKASNPKSAGGGTAPPEFGPDSFIRPSKPASQPEKK